MSLSLKINLGFDLVNVSYDRNLYVLLSLLTAQEATDIDSIGIMTSWNESAFLLQFPKI